LDISSAGTLVSDSVSVEVVFLLSLIFEMAEGFYSNAVTEMELGKVPVAFAISTKALVLKLIRIDEFSGLYY